MNLGLMAMGVNAGLKADREQKVFDYEQAKRAAELSTLDDRVAAERTGYRLHAGQNQQGLDLMRGQTAIKQTEQKTAGIRADMGLSDAQNEQSNQPKTQEIKNNELQGRLTLSRAELEAIPDKLDRDFVQGVISKQGQADMVLGILGSLLSDDRKEDALAFASQISKKSTVLPGTNGNPLSDIKRVNKGSPIGKDSNGNDVLAPEDGVLFITKKGLGHFNSGTAVRNAMEKLRSGKYKGIHDDKTGAVYMVDENSGRGHVLVEGDPNRAAALRGQNTPAEIQTMEYLVSNGVAKNTAHAWEMVRSSREKTRNAFIMDFVSKNAMPGQNTSKIAEQAGAIYDDLRGSTAPAAPAAAPAPTGTPSNWSDWTR